MPTANLSTQPKPPSLRVGLIGYGAIGRPVAEAISQGKAGNARLAAVLVRDVNRHWGDMPFSTSPPPVTFTADADAFFDCDFDLLVEAAGHEAVRRYARPGLEKGADVLIVSVGAFADDELYRELCGLAGERGRRLLLASGALPAVDWMSAAALAGGCTVAITQAKPVGSWVGTPAEEMVDLCSVTEAACFFSGSARQAASRFPKSSNITAMLALSTVGLDETQVRLVADPTRRSMHTLIEFESGAGSLRVEWQGVPSEANPSTSADVPLSVIKAIRNLSAPVCLGV
jgi:aspartate dehydrogenase